jgi:hypothetical protein
LYDFVNKKLNIMEWVFNLCDSTLFFCRASRLLPKHGKERSYGRQTSHIFSLDSSQTSILKYDCLVLIWCFILLCYCFSTDHFLFYFWFCSYNFSVVDKVFVGNINKETSRQEIEEVCVTVHLNNKLLV